MPKKIDIYLDIETSWSRKITVIGFYSTDRGLRQLVGDQITPNRLRRQLPKNGRLFTYNGHSFDFTCIRKELNMDFRDLYDSWDLRWVCQRQGICGGQKTIEDQIGFRRKKDTLGMSGRDAIYLWEKFKKGNQEALDTLLKYNAEDLYGLRAIKRYLENCGCLAQD